MYLILSGLLLGLLYVSYLLFNIILFNIILSKNRKYIHISNKIYVLFDYDYGFISYKMNGSDLNFQLKFNNCIYKYYNNRITNISKFNTYTYESQKHKEITINNTDFVNILGYYNNSTDCKEYKQINMITNNIEDINMEKIKFSYKKKFKITDITIKDYLIDFIDYNFKLYNDFINKFNDPDISIIKIGTHGPCGTGKTYFLKNIRKILTKNDDSFHGYMRILNIDLYNSFKYYYDKYKNTTTNKYKYKYKLNQYLNDSYGYEYVIYYIDFNCTDNFLKTMIDDMFEIINSKKNLLDFKLILLCESFEYTNIYDNFDIIYKGDYINKCETNDIIKNIDNKLNCKINKNLLNNDKLTINDIISQYFTFIYM